MIDPKTIAPNINAMVALSSDHDMPCILCGKPTRDRGALLPNDPEDYGGAVGPGKRRVVIYGICDGHEFSPATASIIDELLLEPGRRGEAPTVLRVGDGEIVAELRRRERRRRRKARER